MYQKLYKILSLYCSNLKKRFHLREISRLSELPLKTTVNNLEKLEKNNIVRSSFEGKHKYYELNLDNIETKFLLIQTEIYRTSVFLNTYPVFKTFLKEIEPANFMAIIFGSFAELTATKDSDLDILITSDKPVELPFHLIPYNIHKINLTNKEFLLSLEKGEVLIKEILTNHIILCNHSYFVDLVWWYYGKKS
jgi:predicted nucleotidyltransferase